MSKREDYLFIENIKDTVRKAPNSDRVDLIISIKEEDKELFLKVISSLLSPGKIFEQNIAKGALAFRELARDKGVDFYKDTPILALEKMGAYISKQQNNGLSEIYIEIRVCLIEVRKWYLALFRVFEDLKDIIQKSYLLSVMPDDDGTIKRIQTFISSEHFEYSIGIYPDTVNNIEDYLNMSIIKNYEIRLYHKHYPEKEYTAEDYKRLKA